MDVIIHLPRSKEGQEELAKRVATVHAQLIYNYISRLECSTEQKVALLDAIQENIHDEIKKEKEGVFSEGYNADDDSFEEEETEQA